MDKLLKSIIIVLLLLQGCAQKTAIIMEGYEKGTFLGFDFKSGMTIKEKHKTDMSVTVETQGFQYTTYSTIEIKTTTTVEDTTDGVLLKVVFDDAFRTTRIQDELKTIKEIRDIIGKSISIKFSKNMEILEVKGVKEIPYLLKHEKETGTQYEESYGFLPNRILKQGESWEKEFENTSATYTLKHFEKKDNIDCARIEAQKKISLTQDIDVTRINGTAEIVGDGIEAQKKISPTQDIDGAGIKGTLEIVGDRKETIFFAVKERIVQETSSKVSIEGEQKITMPTGETKSLPVYMDIKTSTQQIK